MGVFATLLNTTLALIAQHEATRYNCSVGISVVTPRGDGGGVAGLAVLGPPSRALRSSDRFVWGSITKIVTGTGVLQLVAQGKIALSDRAHVYVDPLLARLAAAHEELNWLRSLASVWGPEATNITVRDLLAMQSGAPDFDTATPAPSGGVPTDPLRAAAYAAPASLDSPLQLLAKPWVRTGALTRPPGPGGADGCRTQYSSTNFLVLDLLLASFAPGLPPPPARLDWTAYDQRTVLPPALAAALPSVAFSRGAPPANFTAVHGYDRTRYNGNDPARPADVWRVRGDFVGWGSNNMVGTTADVARLAHALYATQALLPPALVALMVPTCKFYGLACFNLTQYTGQPAPLGVAYGHVGATYGFQSLVSHHPALNVSIAVATNIERDYQEQPADTLCLAFNHVANLLRGLPPPNCSFSKDDFYSSDGCNCTTTTPHANNTT
jgi:CubicO group peptidase (beta-lactamase class C family)